MQSHAEYIQALLARERDLHTRQVGLVRMSLLSVPPRDQTAPANSPAPAGR
jgi:hypothetical protein